ncbi:hypothetical protein M430DRAFT_19385 [Amorphotheca resinae ATCC 22711]|uniref:Uncharacterized protein n=1 Tax=Amorphotheca resinae ATCC 22711 TaxID=857342 RepID=A0A2T3B2K1_AMORE|nr:hypothetical protein M430DRAFT_19385 [Amorphotheca resinae ATCC 22711]PSS18790.1 hypothetical protein M430DRAFT_19385 [Amorphotheca resinae ATCC 22711]
MSGNLANKAEEEIHKMASKTGMEPDKKKEEGGKGGGPVEKGTEKAKEAGDKAKEMGEKAKEGAKKGGSKSDD